MSASRISPTYTVQPASGAKLPKSLYIVAFALSTVAAYWWATAGKPRPATRQEFTSTAFVHVRQGAVAPKLDLRGVRRQVLSQEGLARAAEEIHNTASSGGPGEGASESTARVREKTAVELSVGAAPGAASIAIRYASKNPAAAAQWVNALAGSYAAAYRQQWRSVAEKVYQDSQTAAAGADEQLRQATARLDAFVNEHLKPAAQKAAATPPVPVVHPARVDNPDWVALNRQLGDLLQQRVKLLLDRTPIHPEVQQTELRIAEIQRRLAETQRWIPARQSGGESSLPLAAAQPAAQTAVPAEDPFVTRVALEKLKEVLAAARGASQQAERQQRQARLACQEEPRIELQFAVPQVALPPSMALRLRLALAALAAGLTATVGLGMVATGAAIEPAVRTVAQLRAILTVPVLGVVPETGSTKAARSGRPNLLRLLWIAAGVIVVASCLAAVVLSGK
ncbi:MAG: hypothetical protein ACLQLG_14610 [Thermoguttaceae bacterium]